MGRSFHGSVINRVIRGCRTDRRARDLDEDEARRGPPHDRAAAPSAVRPAAPPWPCWILADRARASRSCAPSHPAPRLHRWRRACSCSCFSIVAAAARSVGSSRPWPRRRRVPVRRLALLPPLHAFAVEQPDDVLALLVFVVVASVVSVLVDQSRPPHAPSSTRAQAEARGTRAARRRNVPSSTTPSPISSPSCASTFGLDASPCSRRRRGVASAASAGAPVPRPPGGASLRRRARATGGARRRRCRALGAADRRLLRRSSPSSAWRRPRCASTTEAARRDALTEANGVRTALLAAVSHDLRNPLATIKASATSSAQRRCRVVRRPRGVASPDHRSRDGSAHRSCRTSST